MWPFSKRKQTSDHPSVRVGEFSVRWNPSRQGWEFEDDRYDYTLLFSPEFDVAVLDRLEQVRQWLIDLDQEIDAAIQSELKGYELCRWTGKKLLSIDVADMLLHARFEATYTGDDSWGDLCVHIVITNGKITEIFGSD